MIEVKGVTKSFGSLQVLKRLSISFAPGETVLLVGANGAGKSTLLRVMAGLTRPDRGSVTNHAMQLGFLSHHLFLYGRLSVGENLALYSALNSASSVSEIVARLELANYLHRPVAELSKGLQARVGIARTFLSRPDLVLLDEPTSNLDEKGTALLLRELELVKRATKNRVTCIIATHDLHRLAPVATRVVVMENGGVAADSASVASDEGVAQTLALYREVNR